MCCLLFECCVLCVCVQMLRWLLYAVFCDGSDVLLVGVQMLVCWYRCYAVFCVCSDVYYCVRCFVFVLVQMCCLLLLCLLCMFCDCSDGFLIADCESCVMWLFTVCVAVLRCVLCLFMCVVCRCVLFCAVVV